MRWLAPALVLAGAAWMAASPDLVRGFPVWIGGAALATAGWGLAWMRSGRDAPGLGLVLLVAVGSRAALLLPDVPLSDDLYRYLWDGRVQAAGLHPFEAAPSADELAPLRDEAIWPRINHPDVPTIYPPTAQLYFRALDALGGGARSPRVGAALCDLLVVLGLAVMLRRRGRPPGLALVYAWCPLVLLESAGGGHVDALGAALIVGALAAFDETRRRAIPGGILFTLASLVKPMAPLAGPALLAAAPPRTRALLLLGGALGLLVAVPYLDGGARLFVGFFTYAEHWEANDAVYSLLTSFGVPARPARWALALATVGISLVLAFRVRDPWRAAALAFGAALLLSPTVHPWYAVWLVPLLPFVRGALGVALVTFVVLLPGAYVTAWLAAHRGGWAEPAWLAWALWGLPLVAAAGFRFVRGRAPADPAA